MKLFPITLLLATLAVGLAGTGYAQYGSCVNNNSKACRDARNAFAEHHGGVFPEQYYNHWYGGNQGRWYQRNNEWRWEGINGDRYWKGHDGWEWHHHDHDHDHDHDNH
jgi:hypothetical protein